MNTKKSVWQNAAFLVVAMGMLGLLSACADIRVSFEPADSDVSFEKSLPDKTTSSESSNLTKVSSNHAKSLTEAKKNLQLAYSKSSLGQAVGKGSLRVSNQTSQPWRLLLLARRSHSKGSTAVSTGGSTLAANGVPAHWDFAPQEGSQKGLLLSLPQVDVKVEKGDILVAFAQDGSGRYWGPCVVGETQAPVWDSQNQEWQLILGQ
jgi:hypothetical protein